jgi:hypothetical protein
MQVLIQSLRLINAFLELLVLKEQTELHERMAQLDEVHFLGLIDHHKLVVVNHQDLDLPWRTYLHLRVNRIIVVPILLQELTNFEGTCGPF